MPGARGKVLPPFRIHKKSPSGRDRKKHPDRAAVPLGSLPASQVGNTGGKMDAERLKTRAEQSGSVLPLLI